MAKNAEHTRVADLRLREYGVAAIFAALTAVTALSGFITHWLTSGGVWVYVNYIGHTLTGILLTGVFLWYGIRHVRRTTGLRRPLAVSLGYLLAIVIAITVISGLYIAVRGTSEALRWIEHWHVYAAYGCIAVIVLHLTAAFLRAGSNAKRDVPRFIVSTRSAVYSILALGTYAAVIGLSTFVYKVAYVSPQPMAVGADYQMNYGDDPFAPSQSVYRDNNAFIPEQVLAASRSCGTCHRQIFEEWQESAHSQAGSDPTYVKNINLLESLRGTSATRYCEGCHAPVALFSGQLTEGGKHGGTPGTPAFHEGVGCLGCHSIERAVHLKGVASYEMTPRETYLFEHSDHPAARFLHRFLIRISPQQHRAAMSRSTLSSPEMCATCHESFMDRDMNNWGWVKLQDDFTAWSRSHYSGRSEQDFQSTALRRCQDCHFPLITGDDPSADRRGQIRSHRSPGANTMLPALNRDHDQLKIVTEFLQSQKVLIDIEEPSRRDATQTLRTLDELIRPSTENAPYFVYLGEKTRLRITVTNAGVGHGFPGGTTDINEAWIYLRVNDSNNATLYESGDLKEDEVVDPSAHFYRSVLVDRAGQHVWKHDLFQAVGDAYKNTIPPGKSDVVEYEFDVPFWAKGQITVTAVVRYRKLNRRYAKWALEERADNLPIVDMARDSLIIPLRERPAATSGTVQSAPGKRVSAISAAAD